MRHVLEDLCTTDPTARRRRLERTLQHHFRNRLKVERHEWDRSSPVERTINYLVSFGRQHDHLVLGAHYDAVPNSPGGNDNAAAVAQLFGAANRLQAAVKEGAPEPDVTFCFWDHEELFGSPYMGSRTYLAEHAGSLPRMAVVFDVSGIGDFYVSGQDPTGILGDLPSRITPPSDNLNLLRAGIPTALVCALPVEELGNPMPRTWATLHTPQDTPDRVIEETLVQGACLALDLITRARAA